MFMNWCVFVALNLRVLFSFLVCFLLAVLRSKGHIHLLLSFLFLTYLGLILLELLRRPRKHML